MTPYAEREGGRAIMNCGAGRERSGPAGSVL